MQLYLQNCFQIVGTLVVTSEEGVNRGHQILIFIDSVRRNSIVDLRGILISAHKYRRNDSKQCVGISKDAAIA